MSAVQDRLYELLPYVYRLRDSEKSEPLKRFLRVIEQQVSLLERDLERSYDNWFIETCEDWVVPYIAELLGYRPVTPAGVCFGPVRKVSPLVEVAQGFILFPAQ